MESDRASGATLVVEGLHHVALAVTDLARAPRFYRDVLGLRELPVAGLVPAAGDRQLHLVVHPPTRTLRGTTEIDSRDGHVALRVASYAGALEHLRRHGVVFRDQYDNLTPWAQIYVTDPDGNVIEINAER